MDVPGCLPSPSLSAPPPSYDTSTAYDWFDSNKLPAYRMSYLGRTHPYLRWSGHRRFHCLPIPPPTYDEPTGFVVHQRPRLAPLTFSSLFFEAHEAVSPTETNVSEPDTPVTEEGANGAICNLGRTIAVPAVKDAVIPCDVAA